MQILQYLVKVALKEATRTPTSVPFLEESLSNFPLKDTMIMGYNANSDSSKKGTDVGALVSSLNPAFSKYSSTCIFRKSDEDVIKEIGPAVMKALRRYREENGKLHIRIIMYRAG